MRNFTIGRRYSGRTLARSGLSFLEAIVVMLTKAMRKGSLDDSAVESGPVKRDCWLEWRFCWCYWGTPMPMPASIPDWAPRVMPGGRLTPLGRGIMPGCAAIGKLAASMPAATPQ